MNRVIGYARVSTVRQLETESIETQAYKITKFCEDNNLHLVSLVKEEDVSGTIPFSRRVGGNQVECALLTRKVDGVVLSKLDRGFRNTADAIATLDNWGRKNYGVYIIDFMGGRQLDTRDPLAKAMLSMVAVFAQLDRDMIATRTREKLQYRKHHKMTYSKALYGYKSDENGCLIKDPIEQEAIALMKQLRQEGKSLVKIASTMTLLNYPKPRDAKEWYGSSIACILSNDIHEL